MIGLNGAAVNVLTASLGSQSNVALGCTEKEFRSYFGCFINISVRREMNKQEKKQSTHKK